MSAIIGSLIPKIEGFQPIPNAVMIPFMEAQSAALAYGFGLNYEYGKRKIRSMSNEEFNSLTSEQIANMSNEHTHIILSKFQNAVSSVMPMQSEIFKQYVTIEKAKTEQNFELAKWMVKFIKEFVDDETAHLLGGHIHPIDSSKPSNEQTFFDPNNPDKDFAPPPGGKPFNPVKPPPPPPAPPRNPGKTPTTPKIITYTMPVPSRFGTNPFRVTGTTSMTKTISQWKDYVNYFRKQLETKKSAGVQKQFLHIISTVSTQIHKLSGQWV